MGINVPIYRKNTQAMLRRMRDVRHNPPMKYMSDERFNQLVQFAENAIAKAIKIEERASAASIEVETGRQAESEILDLYKYHCDAARRAIWTSYDEPLAQSGDRLSKSQSSKAASPRTPVAIDATIRMLAASDEKPGVLWWRFIGELDRLCMEPIEGLTPKDELQVYYTEDATGKAGHITIGRFRDRLRRARKEK